MTQPMNDEEGQARIEELEREEQRLLSDELAAADAQMLHTRTVECYLS